MPGRRFAVFLHPEFTGGWRLSQQVDLCSELFVVIATSVPKKLGFDFVKGSGVARTYFGCYIRQKSEVH